MTDLNKKRWGRHFSDEEIAATRESGQLLTMELETSHVCNLRCVYCYNSSGKSLSNELSLAELQDVIRQGKDLGARRIILIGGGEPLMHPQVMELIEFIRGQNLGVDLFTNGTVIKAAMARTLFELGVSPVVKLNSLDSQVQDDLANFPGASALIHQGLDCLMAAGYPTEDCDLGIESIICAQNYDELPSMWRWARERGITPYFEMITFQGRARNRRDLNVSVERLESLFQTLAKIDEEEYDHHWAPHPPVAGLNCSRHEYSCTITARGYVQPCTGVDLKVGNIRHASLKEILAESVVIQELRSARQKVKGACGECELLQKCYGCRGMAYHLTGDFLAADPLCWRNPEKIKVEELDRG